MSKGVMALVVIGLTILQIIWYGWVLQVLWGWFIVPTFSLAALTIAQALGIALIVRMLTTNQGQTDSDKNDAVLRAAINGFLFPLITLIIGWIVSWFM